jgi:amino acid transporter
MIGWGCFVLPGDFLVTAGPVGATIGIALGGLLMVLISCSHGLMVTRFPFAGGEFVYAYFTAGPHHAYVCGWFLTLGYLAIVPLNATALALLGKFVFPDLFARGYLYSIAGFDVYAGEILLASTAIIVFGWFNYRGVRVVGQTQVLLLLVMVAAVLLLATGSVLDTGSTLANLRPPFAPGRSVMSGVLAIVAIAPWMLSGFDTLPQAAEEFAFSPAQAFRLMLLSIALGVILYLTVLLATSYLMPWPELVAAHPAWATGAAIEQTLGSIGVAILSLAVLMGIFTGMNGFFMAASRLMFSMGRAKILPAWFGRLSPAYGTPSNAIFFAVAISLLAPWFGRPALLWVVDMSAVGIAMGFLYTCTAASSLLKAQPQRAPVRCGPGLAIAGVIASAGFIGLLIVPGSPAFMATPSWIALAGWVTLGSAFYLTRVAHLGRMTRAELDYLILGKGRSDPPHGGLGKS